jgi:chorismate mutase/prephenate dehydratase
MTEPKEDFARIREALDQADQDLVAALEARARATREFAALRERDPEGYYALPRDEEVIARLREQAEQFPSDALAAVLREVLSASANMIAPRRVLYVGPEGGFAHVAARRQFGAASELRAAEDVGDVLEGVARGRASFGIIPFETSSDGALTVSLHGLEQSDVRICGELTLPSSYHLLSQTGNATDVEKIYGAPQDLGACERFIRNHFPRATVLDVPSGEVAAQFAKEDHGAAAVGTDIVPELYELRVVHERIEDTHGVEIRFVVVGGDLPSRTGKDRTVLAMAVTDGPGGLHHALKPFADRDINLTRLESRPSQSGSWNYLFFVELDGHVTDRPVLNALEELRGISRHVKILGSYPRPD